MPLILNTLRGDKGRASIKGLGSLIGEVSDWRLTRREDGRYDLRAVFSFLVPALMLDTDYNEDRSLVLDVARGRSVTVSLDAPEAITLQGKVLFMEGVDIAWAR